MAAVVASKSAGAPSKMKKPSVPLVQTNGNSVKPNQQPSSSPSSAAKRLPGQTQNATTVSATPTSTNGAARPNRRLQRLSTRTGTADNLATDRRSVKKFPEPWIAKESHILKKFDGRPPSLIVHLYPTNFRFEQQDGSFSYHSEMRIFIEHLFNGTVPHDMVEEFREGGVQFYDGWLIVKVVDHINASNSSSASAANSDNDEPFSVHNYNPYITPSPYAPYPTKEQTGQRSPPTKQESGKETPSGTTSGGAVESSSSKPQPQIYHRLLRPTQMSRHMDMVLDALAPDPKSLNRKQSQANVNGRGVGGAPPTPGSAVPSTPLTEKGPPLKKQKMKIESKDLLDYEGRVINATAPPLYLDPVQSAEEAEALLTMMKDPFHDLPPPSPKSRKRTVAELAADDAHAKEQERFMLIMDERNAGAAGTAAVDGQASTTIFQPRFERFNALETIKREMAEKEQQKKDRQLQEDENRREVQQRQVEEDRRRNVQRLKEQHAVRLQQEQHEAHQLALRQQAAQQSRAQAQQQAQAARQQQQQANGIPPQVQSQMMANQRSSPVIRQGTPHAVSSPVVNNAGQGAGSPARPGSAMQHGHPMARNQSNSGQSRHGTPQMPNATPGMRNATPVIRQGTPAQHMTQGSPHANMMTHTPQMANAANMGGQVPNGMTPQQIEMARRQQQNMRMQQQMQQQNMAQQMAQRQAAMQQGLQQQGQQMGQNPAQHSSDYQKQLAQQMKAQMQQVQGGNHGSPMQNQQMTPQQQAMLQQQQQQHAAQQQQRMMQQQQQQQNPMMGNMGHAQQQRPMNPAIQQFYNQAMQSAQSRLIGQTASKYGGNPSNIPQNEVARINAQAQQYAAAEVRKRQQAAQQMQGMRQQQAAQQGMANGMMGHPNMAAMQQQQAQQMQGMQMAHAQQMMQQQQNQNMYQMPQQQRQG